MASSHEAFLKRVKLYLATRGANTFFLVEYPKSGITWLSVMLANAFLLESGSSRTATFASVRNYIPDLAAGKSSRAYRFSPDAPRFYKSHAAFERRFIHTIYLARHPYRVMRSFWQFRQMRNRFPGSLAAFCEDEQYGLENWRRHVRSWCASGADSSSMFLHLIRYEDLLSDPFAELSALSKSFGWALEGDVIRQAIELSSREEMSEQEALYARHNPNHTMQFVGSGHFDEDDGELARMIEQTCGEELSLLGYN